MTIFDKFNLKDSSSCHRRSGLLGTEFCKTLAEAGAAVAVVDLNADAATPKLRMDLLKDGFKAKGIATDITKPDSVNGMVDTVLSTFGRLDVLVNSRRARSKVRPRRRIQRDCPWRIRRLSA